MKAGKHDFYTIISYNEINSELYVMRNRTPVLLILILLQFFLLGYPTASADDDNKAFQDAQILIQAKAFSRQGLIEQLEVIGHSHDSAEEAADAIETDWNEMALKQAGSLLNLMPLSERGLTGKLSEAGFTEEETEYAVRNCGADWKENACKLAASYVNLMTFTRVDLLKQLQFDGFSYEMALYAVTQTLGEPDQSELEATSNPYKVSDEMAVFFTENLDNIFPIQSLKEAYTSVVLPIYTNVGPGTGVQARTREGKQTFRLYANPDSVHEYVYTNTINAGNLRNFMFSMDVTIGDVNPIDQGGCFIGYENKSVTAFKNEEARLVAFVINPGSAEFYTKAENGESGSRTQITSNGTFTAKLTLIRLTGLTFAFLGDAYIGQFYDNNEGPFQLVFGSALYKDGDTAVCSFDNMAVRKVSP